jgi:enoyl-CoA hydratase
MSLIDVSLDESVAIVSLNDGRRRNIISMPLVDELEAALDDIEANEAINTVIITGNGPAFCAGADLADLEAASNGDTDGLKRIYQGFLRVANSPLPTIAAVNGPAVGAGMNLALACDVRIAAESAVFDTRFMDLGLHPGGGHTWMLNRAVGWQASMAMLLLGQKLTGQEAVQRSLAWTCTSDDELLATSIKIAKRAKSFPRELVERTVKSLRNSVSGNDHRQAVDFEYEHQIWSMHQPEFLSFLHDMQSRISGKAKEKQE